MRLAAVEWSEARKQWGWNSNPTSSEAWSSEARYRKARCRKVRSSNGKAKSVNGSRKSIETSYVTYALA
jgi:hypothetical protein